MFITSGNWRGKHNSLSRGAGADQYVTFTIPLKDKKVIYEPTGNQLKYQRDCYRMSLTAYDTFGTLIADTIARFACCSTV